MFSPFFLNGFDAEESVYDVDECGCDVFEVLLAQTFSSAGTSSSTMAGTGASSFSDDDLRYICYSLPIFSSSAWASLRSKDFCLFWLLACSVCYAISTAPI